MRKSTRIGGLAPRSRGRWVVGSLVALLVVVVWWWPGITGDPDDVDVELVLGPGLTIADRSIDRRLREEGFWLARTTPPRDWCSVPDVLDALSSTSDRLVVWADDGGDCDLAEVVDRVFARAGDRRVIVVRLPTDPDDVITVFEDRGAVVVDTGRLLGEPGSSMTCLWWEDCPESGSVEPWVDGRLGPIGGERVARMIVAATL